MRGEKGYGGKQKHLIALSCSHFLLSSIIPVALSLSAYLAPLYKFNAPFLLPLSYTLRPMLNTQYHKLYIRANGYAHALFLLSWMISSMRPVIFAHISTLHA